MSDLPTLDADQQQAVTAFCQPGAGLITLGSVPGAGKSTTCAKAVAADLYRRYANGEPAPEAQLLVVSFSKDDAASLKPDIIAWLRELFERGEVPDSIDAAAVEEVVHRVRHTEWIGTIDSMLRSVLDDIAGEIGFDGMPTIGNKPLLARLQRECYTQLRDSTVATQVRALEDAYPEDVGDSLAEILEDARVYCRTRRLTVDAFERRLHDAITETYAGGQPDAFSDIIDTVARYRGPEATEPLEKVLPTRQRELLEADRDLFVDWARSVHALCQVLRQYIHLYDSLSRERGVIGHLDCAYWVARYFRADAYAGKRRRRLRKRLTTRLDRVVVDEAQDLNSLQHDALAHLIDASTRVLLVGDVDQCIYQWRNAQPRLFETAIDDGTYFGIDWATHIDATTPRNYRSRPAIVRFVNAVARQTLTHPRRGSVGDVDSSFSGIEPTRARTETANLHVAAFEATGQPGTKKWVHSGEGVNEAPAAVQYLVGGLADGTFTDDDGAQPSITALFRQRTYMGAYAELLEDKGVTVADASAYLFDAVSVQVVNDVLEWLCDPTDSERTRRLVTESALAQPAAATGLDGASGHFETHEWDISAIADHLEDVPTAACDELDWSGVIEGLVTLADEWRTLEVEPAATVVRDIVDALGLETDPLALDPDTGTAQRIANLDAFIALLDEWEADEQYTVPELCSLLTPFRDSPKKGPTQPVPDREAVDVVFQTVNSAKGDEADVVLLADPAFNCGPRLTQTEQLVSTGDDVALAPPATAATDHDLPGFSGGFYDPNPKATWQTPSGVPGSQDVGLRWTAEHWAADSDATQADLPTGPQVRRDAAAESRAEAWRLLYVALTRARDHLIIPLPRSAEQLDDRNHWAQALHQALELDEAPRRGSHTVDLPAADGSTAPVTVNINDVALADRFSTGGVAPTQRPPQGCVGDILPTDDSTVAHVPRFLNPSTARPVLRRPTETLLAHLKGDAVHTQSAPVSEAVPFDIDQVGPERVGDLVHEVVIALVDAELTDTVMTPPSERVVAVVDETLRAAANADRTIASVQAGLRQFLLEQIVPQLGKSALWSRVRVAERVFTNEPLQTVLHVDGVEIEVQGEADLVLALPDNTWFVEDLKASFAPLTDETADRYSLQIAIYATILNRQLSADERVKARFTALGVESAGYGVSDPVERFDTALDHLQI